MVRQPEQFLPERTQLPVRPSSPHLFRITLTLFRIDLTAQPTGTGTGLHWQLSQATSLYNVVVDMTTDAGTGQQGIVRLNFSRLCHVLIQH